ncbi:hypothetical protein FQZ97_706180 [compost metagenome]
MSGLAIREQSQQLAAAHTWPRAYIAHIHVGERRAGTRIIANTTDLIAHPDTAQFCKRYTGNEKVHSATQRMLALLGHTAGFRAQHVVGRRRTVGRNNCDVLVGAGRAINLPHKVEQARVHSGRLVATPVAQEDIQFLQTIRQELTILFEGDFCLLTGMDIIELQRTGFSRCLRRRKCRNDCGCNQRCGNRRANPRYGSRQSSLASLASPAIPDFRQARFNGRYPAH